MMLLGQNKQVLAEKDFCVEFSYQSLLQGMWYHCSKLYTRLMQYLCYGITSNCNAFTVAFSIIFGNEVKEGWERFWWFVHSKHPSLNHP